MPSKDELFLREAIRLAAEHSQAGTGGPFGALIVRDGQIIGRGWNQVLATNDPTAHAEVVAIREACAAGKCFHLERAVLYASCEPCPMCLAATCWAHIGRVVYAATREDAAGIGFDDAHFYRELSLPPAQRELPMQQALRDEAVKVMQQWARLPGKTLY